MLDREFVEYTFNLVKVIHEVILVQRLCEEINNVDLGYIIDKILAKLTVKLNKLVSD